MTTNADPAGARGAVEGLHRGPPLLLLTLTVASGLVLLCSLVLVDDAAERYAHHRIEHRYDDGGDRGSWASAAAVEESGTRDPAPVVSEAERLHLARLHAACVRFRSDVVTWEYAVDDRAPLDADDGADVEAASGVAVPGLVRRGDPRIVNILRQCPDVDVFQPEGIRGYGYCEDSVAYVKYLRSRLLPRWVLEDTFVDPTSGRALTYFELCPRTPMLFLNHYSDGVTTLRGWPEHKPIVLMPNIEMYELAPLHLWAADAVLCKTAICARRVRLWYQQQGNPRNASVWLTRHTTSDVAAVARARQPTDGRLRAKDFASVRFVHAAGGSTHKGTRQILDCWRERPDLPPLELLISGSLYESTFQADYDEMIRMRPRQITLHAGGLNASAFARLVAESTFFLCPSIQEGYGHYVNQARASGAVIVTTDLPPLNEFITPTSGVLVPVTRGIIRWQLLGGDYDKPNGLDGVEGLTGSFSGAELCASVDRVLSLTTAEREALARRASAQYEADTSMFRRKMQEFRVHARWLAARARRRESTDARAKASNRRT